MNSPKSSRKGKVNKYKYEVHEKRYHSRSVLSVCTFLIVVGVPGSNLHEGNVFFGDDKLSVTRIDGYVTSNKHHWMVGFCVCGLEFYALLYC